MMTLSDKDRERIGKLEAERAQLHHQLGATRAAYLREETELFNALRANEQRRAGLIEMLASEYLADHRNESWTYDPSKMAFVQGAEE